MYSNVYIVTFTHTLISPCHFVIKNVSIDKNLIKKENISVKGKENKITT